MTHENNSMLPKNISSNALLTGVTVALIFISVFQAIEISRIKGFVQAQGNATLTQSAPSGAASAPAAQQPVRSQSTGLPSQVGGC